MSNMTATQKILAKHSGNLSVSAGDLVTCGVDLVLGNDITSPVAIREFEKVGDKVFDNSKIALVLDHFTPCKDIQSATLCKTVREFAKKNNIEHFYDAGKAGIEHALLPELGLCRPSELIIGADSHTCTYGALGCFSTGIGSTDMAAAMLTGKCWFKVPSAIKINVSGKLQKYVTGKDVILTLIGMLGVDGATYQSLEFFGDLTALNMDFRFTMANMAVECGAKNAFFPVDRITREYLAEKNISGYSETVADSGAEYVREVDLNLSDVTFTVAKPSLPSNVMKLSSGEQTDIAVDEVYIGSCTNGRMTDMLEAAEILKGKKIADGVRVIVVPATYQVYAKCLEEGLLKVFTDAGAIVSPPTCGACLGGHMGVLAADEVAVSTTNRNFVGRMGHPTSKVYLASPYVAAATALAGKLACPKI